MDSGNSGSMQSSSGGDEEYDSRGESITTFLNNNPSPHFGSGSISSHNNINPSFLTHQQPTFFDPHSQNHIDTNFQQSQFNNELIWPPRGLISDHNNNFTGTTSSSSSTTAHQVLLHQNPFSSSASLSIQQSSPIDNVVRASNMAQPEQQPNVGKNPKKRTRASRRAPTTVLTTDTTNFRQMVQEFTGIPTAPFTGSPYSRRLDLFSTAGSTMRSSHLDSLGPLYPLRPSAQKVQVSPFMPQLSSASSSSASLLSSSMIDALMPTHNNNAGNTSASTNFQLGSPAAQNNLFNMQNQIRSYKQHSILANNAPMVFGTKSQGSSSSTMNVPSLEELGISHEQVSANLSGFQGNISSQARNDGNNISRLWRSSHDGGQENQLRSFDGNNNGGNNSSQHVSGYKLNSSTTSEFHIPEKGLENVCSTGDQGPVSSWNCPSE